MSAKQNLVEAERAKLRAAGYTETEVSQILIARAAAPSQKSTGNNAPGNSFGPQGPMSGVLSNGIAAISYIVRWIPSIKDDVRNACNDKAPPVDRVMAFGQVAIKLAVLAVIAFAIKQEWDIHIISAHETAEAQAIINTANAKALTINGLDFLPEPTACRYRDSKSKGGTGYVWAQIPKDPNKIANGSAEKPFPCP